MVGIASAGTQETSKKMKINMRRYLFVKTTLPPKISSWELDFRIAQDERLVNIEFPQDINGIKSIISRKPIPHCR